MYIYPPIAKFKLSPEGKIVDLSGFNQYHKKPYVYQICKPSSDNPNKDIFLGVWEYDEENKMLIGQGGQSQPIKIRTNNTSPSEEK
jgi:hypothetical protein